jgi:hypothetical protein
MPLTPGLEIVAEKLARRTDLSPQDRAAIMALPHVVAHLRPTGRLVREGVRPSHCSFILSGFAYRDKIVRARGRSRR